MTIAFAHRGAPRRGRRENTLRAFREALEAGLTALESDVWLTADSVPVLVHDGVRWHRARRRDLRDLRFDELPPWLPRLADLYDQLGSDFDLSLDLKNAAAAQPVLDVTDGVGATSRLWLCADLPSLVHCRHLSGTVRLANSTSLRGQHIEPLVRHLADEGIDALNLRQPEWTAARVELAHAADRLAFAWDVQTRPVLDRVLAYGCDAVYSDSVELLRQA